MRGVINKTNGKILGSIIKMNRLHKNMSQKALAGGICVGSYLSRIENGEILPSEQVIAQLFTALEIAYNDDEVFLSEGTRLIDRFLEELNINEFETSSRIFSEIDQQSERFRHSPLIIDYYIARLAYYCTTHYRDTFEETSNLLESVIDLMTYTQKFRYFLYRGIDQIQVARDTKRAYSFLTEAKGADENGHLWYWLGYLYLIETNAVKAFECFTIALQYYLSEANLLSIMGTYEMMGLVYAAENHYEEAKLYFDKGHKIAEKLGLSSYIRNFENHVLWLDFRGHKMDRILKTVVSNVPFTGYSIPGPITKVLAGLAVGNREEAEACSKMLIEIGSYDASYTAALVKDFDFQAGLPKSEIIPTDLLKSESVLMRQYAKEVLVQFFKAHRRYKEVAELLEKDN